MMSEMGPLFHELQMHERQTAFRNRARKEQHGVTSDRERRRPFPWIARHHT